MLCIYYADEISVAGYSSDANELELDQHVLMTAFDGTSMV